MTSAVSGRTVIVTGAAGGVGAATARRFAESGATLVLGDLDAVALEDLCGRLAALAELARDAEVTDRLADHGRWTPGEGTRRDSSRIVPPRGSKTHPPAKPRPTRDGWSVGIRLPES